jgi:hypothetical protein
LAAPGLKRGGISPGAEVPPSSYRDYSQEATRYGIRHSARPYGPLERYKAGETWPAAEKGRLRQEREMRLFNERARSHPLGDPNSRPLKAPGDF